MMVAETRIFVTKHVGLDITHYLGGAWFEVSAETQTILTVVFVIVLSPSQVNSMVLFQSGQHRHLPKPLQFIVLPSDSECVVK
jgi:hypothetical protein